MKISIQTSLYMLYLSIYNYKDVIDKTIDNCTEYILRVANSFNKKGYIFEIYMWLHLQ